MEWNKIRNRQAGQGAGCILAAEGDGDFPLPDPEELQRRRQAQEKAFERMLGNARELRRRLLALLDMLPEEDGSNSQEKPEDSPPKPDGH
jgi:hypothetical protein